MLRGRPWWWVVGCCASLTRGFRCSMGESKGSTMGGSLSYKKTEEKKETKKERISTLSNLMCWKQTQSVPFKIPRLDILPVSESSAILNPAL